MAKAPNRLVEDIDAVELSPADRHLLSLVDGTLSEEDLAFVTGKDAAAVAESLERLALRGLVELETRSGATGASGDRDGAAASGSSEPGSEPAAAGQEQSAAPLTPDEEVELSAEDRQAVDDLHEKVGRCNYYELLGVETDASKKEIRKAYNKLARRFHPDRHFRKKLGPYKRRIEMIFARLTEAHDTLRSNKRRREYDDSERIERRFDAEATEAKPDRADDGTGTDAAAGEERSARPTQPAAPPSAAPEPSSAPPRGQGPSPSTTPNRPASNGTTPSAPGASARRPAAATSLRPAAKVRPRVVGAAGRAPASVTANPPRTAVRPTSAVGPRPSEPRGRPSSSPTSRRGPAGAVRRGGDQRTSEAPASGVEDDAARQVRADALRRKLRASGRVPAPASTTARSRRPTSGPSAPSGAPVGSAPTQPYPAPSEVEQSAAEVFRARFDKIGAHARRRRCERYLAQGKAAYARGDLRLAAEAFRLAAELAPEDESIRTLAEQTAEQAANR